MSKPRLLWMNEASFLATGYGVYGREVLSRLHRTGKYEIAELGGYAKSNDNRAMLLPWKYYGCLPETPEQDAEYGAAINNQWGAWRFEEILLDFQPTHVLDIRDPWCFDYQAHSPFRRHFNWCIMPTVDSAPQLEHWLSVFMDADAVCAYVEYGRDTLLKETSGLINFCDIAPASADYDVFQPVPDKAAHKEAMGFEDGVKIVGTIMRNQKRKLYPDLIEAFKLFIEQHPDISREVYLYLHTSYPDIGWDIPRLIKESGIGHRILVTYLCHNCNHVFPSFFHDAVRTCPKCGQPTARLPSTVKGVSREQLAGIINTFDVYVQYSVCEGFGIPIVEAAACGVPVMAVDYSAMSSVVRNVKGTPIKVLKLFRESETHAYRAYPDNNDLADKLAKFFKKPQSLRDQDGRDAYVACRRHYNWDKTAQTWEAIIDSLGPKTPWDAPPHITTPNMNFPANIPLEDFVKWCVVNVFGDPSMIDSYEVLRMIRDINYGEAIAGHGGPYYSEDSLLVDKQKFRSYGKQDVVRELLALADKRNYWEQRRMGLSQETTPDYIRLANSRRRD